MFKENVFVSVIKLSTFTTDLESLISIKINVTTKSIRLRNTLCVCVWYVLGTLCKTLVFFLNLLHFYDMFWNIKILYYDNQVVQSRDVLYLF